MFGRSWRKVIKETTSFMMMTYVAEPNGLGEGKYLGPVFVTVMMRLSSALALTVALNCRHWKTDKQILQNV